MIKSVEELLLFFPDAEILREQDGDRMYGDREINPGCGFLSLRESQILFDIVKSVGGLWCEIGSHVGWSAVVIMNAEARVLMVEPEYAAGGMTRDRMIDNLERAGALRKSMCAGIKSEDFFSVNHEMFDGFLIDGDHDSPAPLNDAIGASKWLRPGGAIVLHDFNGQPIKEALKWLKENGFSAEIHDTMNGLAVCRRVAA
jgi:predicted O-methyltransferase YrrM